MKNISCIAIIPARFASTRFPGKPLAILAGKPIIEHVYERVSEIVDDVYVAVDDQRIFDCVESFGGKAIMTSPNHKSGTDRVAEAYKNIGKNFDVVINVQGDEPFIHKEQISDLIGCFEKEDTDIATIVKPYAPNENLNALLNPNTPKVVISKDRKALYFSRSVIPYLRGVEQKDWLASHTYYKHIGIYGFRSKVLEEITLLPQGSLEKAESLEQLRWLENGYNIRVAVNNFETVGIDTKEDLERAELYISRNS